MGFAFEFFEASFELHDALGALFPEIEAFARGGFRGLGDAASGGGGPCCSRRRPSSTMRRTQPMKSLKLSALRCLPPSLPDVFARLNACNPAGVTEIHAPYMSTMSQM